MLSFYAIVRNEEAALPHMLESIRGIANEIVLADTGCTDNSEAVAAQFFENHDFPDCSRKEWVRVTPDDFRDEEKAEWEGMHLRCERMLPGDADAKSLLFHFSACRNAAMRHLTGDWILHLDCDETLSPEARAAMPEVLAKLPPQIKVPMVPIVMHADDGHIESTFCGERLYRRDADTYFTGAMHNCLVNGENDRVLLPQLVIDHQRAVRSHESRAYRNRQREVNAECFFGWRLEKDPNDTRALFYLGIEYMNSGRWNDAAGLFGRYVEVSGKTSERCQTHIYLARCLANAGDNDAAIRAATLAIADGPWRAEAFILLGDLHGLKGDFEVAEQFYQQAICCKQKYDPMFIEDMAFTWQPFLQLGKVYMQGGELVKYAQAMQQAETFGLPRRYKAEMLAYNIPEKPKIAVFIDRGDDKFIRPILNVWKDRMGEIRTISQEQVTKPEDIQELLEWCDVAWFEWATELLIAATRFEKQCAIVVRVHGYEAHGDFPAHVNWDRVDTIIYTAPFLADLMHRKFSIHPDVKEFYVPNGVDVDFFRPLEGAARAKKKIGMAGYINPKKNFPLALQVLERVRQAAPDIELHICGEMQDERTGLYIRQMEEELELGPNLYDSSWKSPEELMLWYQDKDWVLSTSTEESFHYALAEGMASGCLPVIHCWNSSRELYPPERIFRTVEEAVSIILADKANPFPVSYRQWILDNLSLEKMLRRYERILRRCHVTMVGDAVAHGEPWRIENHVANAIVGLGCLMVRDSAKMAIILGTQASTEIIPQDVYSIYWNAEQIEGEDDHALMRRAQLAKVMAYVKRVVHSKSEIYLGGARPPFRYLAEVNEKDIDCLWYGVVNERRANILTDLQNAGVNVTAVEEYNHDNLNQMINRAKCVLNLHCTDTLNFETRIGEALASGAWIISEPLTRNDYRWPILHVIEQPTELLADAIKGHLSIYDSVRRKAEKACSEWTWRFGRLDHQVEKVLELGGV